MPMFTPYNTGEANNALTGFLNMFNQVSARKQQQREFAAHLAQAGLTTDENGNYVKTPEQLKKEQLGQTVEGLGAYTHLLGEGGSEAANPFAGKLGLIPENKGQAQPGLMPDQSNNQPIGQGLLPQNVPSKRAFEMQKYAAEKNAGEEETGRHLEYNPSTGGFIQTSVPLGRKAQLEMANKSAELKNKSLEPETRLQEEYSKEPTVKTVNDSAFALNKMMQAYQHPSPANDKSLVFSQARLENPEAVARASTLEDLRNIPGMSASTQNKIEEAINGTLSKESRDDLMRTGIHLYQGARESHKDVQQKYQSIAQGRGVNPRVIQDPGLENTDKRAGDLANKLGPYVPLTERPTMMGRFTRGLKGLLGGSQASPAQTKPPTVIQNGHTYNLNPQTGEYE